MSSNQNEAAGDSQPSMIAGHAKFVQGAIASTFGYESGESTKQEGVQEMRDANREANPPGSRPAQSNILGTVENAAGRLTGCEGMEKEGAQRQTKGGSEEASGTG